MAEQAQAPIQPHVDLPQWKGEWAISTDGRYEVRPIVAGRAEGYVAGYQASELGDDGQARFAEKVHPTLQEAKASAQARSVEKLGEYDAPIVRAAESGKSYRGPIVGLTELHAIQRIESDHPGAREVHIRHLRNELSSLAKAGLTAGAKVELRYPLARIGIVSAVPERQLQTPASKGLVPKGFGA